MASANSPLAARSPIARVNVIRSWLRVWSAKALMPDSSAAASTRNRLKSFCPPSTSWRARALPSCPSATNVICRSK